MHKSIVSIDKRIAALQATRAARLADLQCTCAHELIAECDYKPSEHGSAQPPIRVCETCGMSEEGWGSGYRVLYGDRTREVSRNDLYEMRAGLMIQDRHKGPLGRREVTIEQLVRGEVKCSG